MSGKIKWNCLFKDAFGSSDYIANSKRASKIAHDLLLLNVLTSYVGRNNSAKITALDCGYSYIGPN
jgi:hypothetical protein